jgi:hypothetical protein
VTPLQTLQAVRSLLSREEAWTKLAPHLAADGRRVSVWHPHACKFSLTGAFSRIQHYTQSKSVDLAKAYLTLQIDPAGQISLEAYNNALGTTHYAVLSQLDSAIRSLGGTPPEQEDE